MCRGELFAVIIINNEIDYINLPKFNLLTPNTSIKFFFHLQLFDVKFFSKNISFCKPSGRKTAVYGCVSLVSDFQLTRKNDDLLSSRHE